MRRLNIHVPFLTALLLAACCSATFAQDAAVKQLPAKSLARLGQFPQGVVSAVFSPDGKYLAAGSYEEVRLFDATSHQLLKTVKIPSGDARSLAFSPDSQQLAVGYYQEAALYSVPALEPTVLAAEPAGYVTGLSFSPDGKWLAAGIESEEIILLSTADKKPFKTLTGHRSPVQGVAFSPDGKLLASVAGDEYRVTRAGEVKLWNPETGDEVGAFDQHERAAFSVNFSPDGKYLVTTGLDEKCIVYDMAERKPLGFFNGHGRPTNSAVFARGNKVVISGAGGRAKGKNDVILWTREEGEELGKISAHEEKINAVALHPDGRTLAVASGDGTVSVWDIAGPLSAVAETAVAAATQDTPKKEAAKEVLKVGVIGLDTSHVIAFTRRLNEENPRPEFQGYKVVAAYPEGSKDIPSSTSRVPGYTEQVQGMGVEIVDTIEALCEKVDAVLLESNDGRPHLEQLIPCLKAGKPVFIDKPVAGTLADAIAIFEASKKFGVPVFSSSSLRYTPGAQELRNGKLGKVFGCDAYSPCSLEATHPDLFWYGIHGVETLFTVMGTGCQSVARASTDDFELVTGVWEGGRIGTFRGIRAGKGGYGGTAFGEKGISEIGAFAGYEPLLVEIVKFFKSGEVPVSAEETLEIYAFMEAADESKRQGGKPVTIESVMAKAKVEAAARLKEVLGE